MQPQIITASLPCWTAGLTQAGKSFLLYPVNSAGYTSAYSAGYVKKIVKTTLSKKRILSKGSLSHSNRSLQNLVVAFCDCYLLEVCGLQNGSLGLPYSICCTPVSYTHLDVYKRQE